MTSYLHQQQQSSAFCVVPCFARSLQYRSVVHHGSLRIGGASKQVTAARTGRICCSTSMHMQPAKPTKKRKQIGFPPLNDDLEARVCVAGPLGSVVLRLLNPTRHLSDIIAAALRTRKLWDRDAVSRSGFRCLLLVKSVCAPAAATAGQLTGSTMILWSMYLFTFFIWRR